ncbi:MAG TPA: hypothetical protein VFW25_00410 [Silvibacterium sp.]|nr:hypothetical protein [Silvibacterium sp.]
MLGRKLWIAALLLLLTMSVQAQQAQRSVLLPPSDLSRPLLLSPGDRIQPGNWKPNKADIDGLEAKLSTISGMKAERWEPSLHIEHPEQYFKQYVAVIRGGEKLIYVNAFCEDPPPADWRRRLVVVLDGGTCFWQALYDPSTREFSHLIINSRG